MKLPCMVLLAALAFASASAGAVRLSANVPTADSSGTTGPISGDLLNPFTFSAGELMTFSGGSAGVLPAARDADTFGGGALGQSVSTFAAADGPDNDSPAGNAAASQVYALLLAGLAGVAFVSSRRFN